MFGPHKLVYGSKTTKESSNKKDKFHISNMIREKVTYSNLNRFCAE